jgi:hypothetical protein
MPFALRRGNHRGTLLSFLNLTFSKVLDYYADEYSRKGLHGPCKTAFESIRPTIG